MADMDNDATMIRNNFEDATQIVDSNEHAEKIVTAPADESMSLTSQDNKNHQKILKAAGGVAVGGAALSGAASVILDNMEDTPEEEVAVDNIMQDNITISAEEVELPELVVEALAPKHEESGSATLSGGILDDEAVSSSETIFAEVYEPKPEKTEESNYAASTAEETVTAQSAVRPEADAYAEDIPVVSVGNGLDNESDIQILGVSQDISTGYNVGRLSVDGEEVVVIDVDGDMVFDSMVADLNHDGDITPDEIVDISQHSLTLDSLSGHSDIFTDPLGGDDPDYLSEL